MEKIVARAIRLAGGAPEVARQLNIRNPWAVYKWVRANKVPPHRVIALESLTHGQVTRHELAPDLYPSD